MQKVALTIAAVASAALLFACHPSLPTSQPTALTPPAGSTANPPLIPHAVAEADSGADCLACHRDGEEGAPPTPHPWLVDCRQCHVPQLEGVAPFPPAY